MSIVVANEVTYDGIRQFEVQVQHDSVLHGAMLVCKQDYRGSRTWRVVHSYYTTPPGEKFPVKQEETLASGLTKAQAKRFATEFLTRSVTGVEPGGRLKFMRSSPGGDEHDGQKTIRCRGCGAWLDPKDPVGDDGHTVTRYDAYGNPYPELCGPCDEV